MPVTHPNTTRRVRPAVPIVGGSDLEGVGSCGEANRWLARVASGHSTAAFFGCEEVCEGTGNKVFHLFVDDGGCCVTIRRVFGWG
jgi:hypothetical protein